ncbi:hypothetical protein A2410_01205 [Candidatus Shapirobacteria bacterium RIFOXYC1_FULL_38_24]|uniref:Uncharacterized protein n=1 Tax=Candidatus Shapirobacteria bacterium GW2011_GWE2_38_30 TaxID=1618490 RepID=A0A0G0MY76_9BACT|nr:MAG: hypothetical protein US90_C0010G0014 [Candidatus Shapirobacteria bacterium GW2011_GWE2_38_30]OGL56467.1 MAG: hypothetical protein A2195_03505 [Candidatus Shapirobacteria bacterium RIFOXYA1_FULL_39_17]OGL56980.1 MAG: hypothetical protein A2410_01205 [Candidatus Shapirobacteria bacterium RIFOXYC1_FULL_38_24]HAP37758.1 hypothetical protein [Candidatus Shapirobacteria bacterium]HCU55334.1 hypothetical protein [Candidatus Shapirobacteria bacterium]
MTHNRQDIPIQSQNIDSTQNNPLFQPETQPTSPKTENPTSKKINTKVILFGILIFISILLLLVSSLVNPQKKSTTKQVENIPTPTLTSSAIPTQPEKIPTQFRDKFDQIDKLLQPNNFPNPPQIDPNIGLK